MPYTTYQSSSTNNITTISGNTGMYSLYAAVITGLSGMPLSGGEAISISSGYGTGISNLSGYYNGYFKVDSCGMPYRAVGDAAQIILGSMINDGANQEKIISLARMFDASIQLCVEYVYQIIWFKKPPMDEIERYLESSRSYVVKRDVHWAVSPDALVKFTKYNVKVINDEQYSSYTHDKIKNDYGSGTASQVCRIQAPSKYVELCDTEVDEDTI